MKIFVAVFWFLFSLDFAFGQSNSIDIDPDMAPQLIGLTLSQLKAKLPADLTFQQNGSGYFVIGYPQNGSSAFTFDAQNRVTTWNIFFRFENRLYADLIYRNLSNILKSLYGDPFDLGLQQMFMSNLPEKVNSLNLQIEENTVIISFIN
jgi:hypothetical protein